MTSILRAYIFENHRQHFAHGTTNNGVRKIKEWKQIQYYFEAYICGYFESNIIQFV